MKVGAGLLFVLIGVGLLMFLYAQNASSVAKSGKPARDQARQIAGYGNDGRAATESVTVEGNSTSGGRMTALVVKAVVPGGTMQRVYGLQAGDEITAFGDRSIDIANGDEELARAMLLEAYQANRPLTVRRGGQPVTLAPAATGGGGAVQGIKIPMH